MQPSFDLGEIGHHLRAGWAIWNEFPKVADDVLRGEVSLDQLRYGAFLCNQVGHGIVRN